MKISLCLLTLAFALSTGSAIAADICSDLDQLISTSGDFSSLRGDKSGDDQWDSTLTITGFDACFIGTYEDSLTFECSKLFVKSRDMVAHLQEVADAIWACPGVTTRTLWESKGEGEDTTWSYFNDGHQFGITGGQDIFSNGNSKVDFHMFED